MKFGYQLSCESTVDLPYEYMRGREIEVLFYTLTVNGEVIEDNMGRDPEKLASFYETLQEGIIPQTSQINEFTYEEYFRGLLEKGDVLHIAFGSGMSGSVQNAFRAAETLREEFPGRKITVIDSLCSCSGYGFFVDEAADRRDAGATMEELEAWIMENRESVHHQFFTNDLKWFRNSGRVSGPAATIASILNICPLMRLNLEGRIVAYDKVRGQKKALEKTIQVIVDHARDGLEYTGKIFISHAWCPENAEAIAQMIRERFTKVKEIRITEIGMVIASHCGPGTLAIYFMGDPRPV